jgi:hypothetical protein
MDDAVHPVKAPSFAGQTKKSERYLNEFASPRSRIGQSPSGFRMAPSARQTADARRGTKKKGVNDA